MPAVESALIIWGQPVDRGVAVRSIGLPLLALLLAGTAAAEQVVRVKDGDSLVVSSAGRQVDVRLAGIDAPELRQARGGEARTVLASLVDGREVELQLVGGDAYRRIVAHVLVDGLDVNEELVRRGLAWVPRRYDPAPALVRTEHEAQAAGRGVWADPDAVPPWEWRAGGRRAKGASSTTPEQTVSVADVDVECGSKRYCREMASCAEAKAYLDQCELGGMDGDKDGVPCEKLCG